MKEEIKIDEFGRYYTNVGIYKGILNYTNLMWINSETGNTTSTTVSKGKPVPKQEPFVDNEKRPIVDYTNKPIPYPKDFSKDFNITESFTLHELLRWDNWGRKNIPNNEEFDTLVKLTKEVLQPIRDKWGRPLTVNSGFRCEWVNSKAGGVENSDHLYGAACDLEAYDKNGELFNMVLGMLKNGEIHCRQLLWEFGTTKCPAWVHVAINNNHNGYKDNDVRSISNNFRMVYNSKTFTYHF